MIAGRNTPLVKLPTRRRLRAFAFDPMATRLSGRYLDIDVRLEELAPGPVGELLKVVDFDGTRAVWYRPVDLDDPAILAQGGLRPTEGDPRTHQQVVYAVAMSVIERFERFLGRRFRWTQGRALVLVPHAFEGRNAYFDPTRRAVLFGYYRADQRDPGPNLPGQVMFTCLSADIIAHEVTHALVHRLRPNFSIATNPDVFAWHEAFADLVALFHHFTFTDVVADAVAAGRGDLSEGKGLFDLAGEFGLSTGRGAALRSAIGSPATPDQFLSASEPHERGACFVAAVFDAFIATYRTQIGDLLRIATGGTGVLPPGHLHPDLVARVTSEATKNAERFLGMVVRSFDFLPVVDVTFGDVVRAIVTADRALYPDDDLHLRATLVERLRLRGIYPARIASLADEALAWPTPRLRPAGGPATLSLPPEVDLSGLVHSATQDLDPHGSPGSVRSDDASPGPDAGPEPASAFRTADVVPGLAAWAQHNAVELGLDPSGTVGLSGLHVVYQQAADRQPRPLIVVQFTQRRQDLEDQRSSPDARIPMRAGTTVVARADGRIEYLIAKPLPLADEALLEGLPEHLRDIGRAHHDAGRARLHAMRAWLDEVEDSDALSSWASAPAASRLTFANLHAEIPGA